MTGLVNWCAQSPGGLGSDVLLAVPEPLCLRAASKLSDAGIEHHMRRPERGSSWPVGESPALGPRGAPYLSWPRVGQAARRRGAGLVPIQRSVSHARVRA